MQAIAHDRSMAVQTRRSTDAASGSIHFSDLLKGALAGAVGTVALDMITWFLWDRESPQVRDQERRARSEGMDPAHFVANQLARSVGTELHPKEPHPAGVAVHFAIGVLPAAVYGVTRKQVPQVRTGRGLLYGLALFLVQDELINSVAGLSGRPSEYPWQAHARGLVGHLVYGAVTDAALEVLDRKS